MIAPGKESFEWTPQPVSCGWSPSGRRRGLRDAAKAPGRPRDPAPSLYEVINGRYEHKGCGSLENFDFGHFGRLNGTIHVLHPYTCLGR